MMDARFDDGREMPLNLGAESVEDLTVVSGLAQDAIFPASEMSWRASERRFALLLNRFRWEDQPNAEKRGRSYERVQSLLVIDTVLGVSSQGIDRKDKDVVLSLLSISFDPAEDGSGYIVLTLAGDGAIRLKVEAIQLSLRDVTRPYVAPSNKVPDHKA